jgi:hypothetical protein
MGSVPLLRPEMDFGGTGVSPVTCNKNTKAVHLMATAFVCIPSKQVKLNHRGKYV